MLYFCVCSFPACPPGSYKMSSRQQECFPCPANSVAEEDGSVACVCEEDHFRTPLDTPSAPCTRNNISYICLYICVFSGLLVLLPSRAMSLGRRIVSLWHFCIEVTVSCLKTRHYLGLSDSSSIKTTLLLRLTCPSPCILSSTSPFSSQHPSVWPTPTSLVPVFAIYPHCPICSSSSSDPFPCLISPNLHFSFTSSSSMVLNSKGEPLKMLAVSFNHHCGPDCFKNIRWIVIDRQHFSRWPLCRHPQDHHLYVLCLWVSFVSIHCSCFLFLSPFIPCITRPSFIPPNIMFALCICPSPQFLHPFA